MSAVRDNIFWTVLLFFENVVYPIDYNQGCTILLQSPQKNRMRNWVQDMAENLHLYDMLETVWHRWKSRKPEGVAE